MTLAGRVLLSDRTPVSGALVVLADHPAHRETRTGPDGSYRFKNVRGRGHSLFIDARRVVPADTHDPVRLVPNGNGDLILYRKRRLGADITNAVAVHDDVRSQWVNINSVSPGKLRDTLIINSIPMPSTYTVIWAKLPLNVCFGGGSLQAGNPTVRMNCREAQSRNVAFSAENSRGDDVAVALYISSFAEDPDPLEIDTTPGMWQWLTKVNVDSIIVWVDEAEGCFNGTIQIPASNKVKVPLREPWTCYGADKAAPARAP